MKLSRAEVAVIAVTIAFLAFTIGYFVGKSSVGDGYYIEPQENVRLSEMPAAQEQTAGTEAEPTEPAALTEAPTISPGERVNINTDGLDRLTLLPGIGEALGQRIIDYREANGAFDSVDDIMNVSGIGDEKFLKIKDYITV